MFDRFGDYTVQIRGANPRIYYVHDVDSFTCHVIASTDVVP